jgi:hypothetical protein
MRNVGCRFRRPGPDGDLELPRFSVLARMPDDNQLVVLTIDYGGRSSGASRVEVQGLSITEPSDEDWEALAATPNLPARCHRANADFAPSDPPAASP